MPSRRWFLATTTLLGLASGCSGRSGTDGSPETSSPPGTTTVGAGTTAGRDPGCPGEDETTTYDPDSPCDLTRLADLRVSNGSPGSVTVHVVVADVDAGTAVLDRRSTVDEGGSVAFGDPVRSGGKHRVRVGVEDGPTGEYAWDVPAAESSTDAYGLRVRVEPDDVSFTEAVQ